MIFLLTLTEGSLEVKLPTIWTDEKQRWEESEKRREKEKISKKRKCTLLWRKAHSEVKMYKTCQPWSTFGC
jgi:hypothetical protein